MNHSNYIPLTKQNTKIGTKVTINPRSKHYSRNQDNNPRDEIGKIINQFDRNTFQVEVKWPYYTNVYDYTDLLVVEHVLTPKQISKQDIIDFGIDCIETTLDMMDPSNKIFRPELASNIAGIAYKRMISKLQDTRELDSK